MINSSAFFRVFRSAIAVLALVTLACVAQPAAWAEQRELKTDAAEQVDAILLLDASGSMLVNDP